MAAIFFGFFAGITVFSALAVAFQRNLLYAAFLLLATFMGVAALFLLANAEFLAVTQLLIYVGGILTLILFGILITKRRELRFLSSGVQNQTKGALIALSLFVVLVTTLYKQKDSFMTTSLLTKSTKLIGYGLLGDYLLPFELAGVLLLVVLIGVLALASSANARQ